MSISSRTAVAVFALFSSPLLHASESDAFRLNLRFEKAGRCDWSVTIPLNTSHPGGNRRGALEERNYGVIWVCAPRSNDPTSLLGFTLRPEYLLGSFENSQSRPLTIAGGGLRLSINSFQEPFLRRRLESSVGVKIFAAEYVRRNGRDVERVPLPTWNRTIRYHVTSRTWFGLTEERVLRANTRTRMIEIGGVF